MKSVLEIGGRISETNGFLFLHIPDNKLLPLSAKRKNTREEYQLIIESSVPTKTVEKKFQLILLR